MAQVQIGPQIRIDVDGGTAAANEISIASSDFHPNEIVAAWNDWRQIPPNPTGDQIVHVGVAVSNDGGATWSDFLVRPPPAYQSYKEYDPMTAYDDRTGTLWVGGITAVPLPSGGFDTYALFTARKIVGEPAFEPSVMVSTSGYTDKGWMAAGPAPGNPNATNLYIAHKLGVHRSTDMGNSWAGPVSLGFGVGFLPRVGPNGELYVAYWDLGYGVFLRRSFDGGQTFGPAIRIATRMDYWAPQDGSRFPGRFRVGEFNYLAVDKNNGTLYCVYFDTTNIINDNRNVDLYFTKSADQGLTWTTPVVINGDADPPGDQFFPWIEVDDNGGIHMVFLDSRNTVQNDYDLHGMFDAYYSYSDNEGATWQEFRLTPESFDSFNDALNLDPNQFLGDYLGLARGQCQMYPCYLSTQNGNPDIYTHVVTVGPVTASCVGTTCGACCVGTTCTVAAQSCCNSGGGTFKGTGTDCQDCNLNGFADACELPVRACCLPPEEDSTCIETTQACCENEGGSYLDGKTHCTPWPCYIITSGPGETPPEP